MTVQEDLSPMSHSSLNMHLLLLFLISVFVSSTLHAQDSTRDNLIKLMDVMGGEQQMAGILLPLKKMISDIGEDLDIQQDEQYLVEKYKNKMLEELQSKFSWEVARENMIEAYESHYTEIEMLDMLAYYNSETGRAMLQKGPQVQAEINKVIASKVAPIQPKIRQQIKDFFEK